MLCMCVLAIDEESFVRRRKCRDDRNARAVIA